jgi:quercetin dioxygenase-like cupin family protein
MNIELTQANISLDARHGISLTDAAGVAVKVLTGRVWLTMDGDKRDIVLPPGDTHTIERNGLTLVNALEPSVVHVQPPRARPAAWKRWLMNVWDWLVSVGEARVAARIKRGIYHF